MQTAQALLSLDDRADHPVLCKAMFLASSLVGPSQFAGGLLVPKPIPLHTPASGASEGSAFGRLCP
jgi:hypothetical protein